MIWSPYSLMNRAIAAIAWTIVGWSTPKSFRVFPSVSDVLVASEHKKPTRAIEKTRATRRIRQPHHEHPPKLRAKVRAPDVLGEHLGQPSRPRAGSDQAPEIGRKPPASPGQGLVKPDARLDQVGNLEERRPKRRRADLKSGRPQPRRQREAGSGEGGEVLDQLHELGPVVGHDSMRRDGLGLAQTTRRAGLAPEAGPQPPPGSTLGSRRRAICHRDRSRCRDNLACRSPRAPCHRLTGKASSS